MTKTFEISDFGHWNLFVICYLIFVILYIAFNGRIMLKL